MNKMVKRISLLFIGAALVSWGSVASVQAYDVKPAQLRVIVTGLGQAIPGSTVTVGDESGQTGINGEVIFALMPGYYDVSVTGAHGGSASETIQLEEDELRQKNFELGVEGALPHGEHH